MRVRPEGPQLISEMVRKNLGADCSVLMGANIAGDIGAGQLSEATIGCATHCAFPKTNPSLIPFSHLLMVSPTLLTAHLVEAQLVFLIRRCSVCAGAQSCVQQQELA